MPVFISHKREDTDQAAAVAQYLGRRNVVCYLDVLDPKLKTTDDLTALLMQRVRSCTHLMAVVSEYTIQSWWVPFEIGVASELERRVTSYQLGPVALPDFLKKWPILRTQSDLDKFIQYYRADAAVPSSERLYQAPSISVAAEFHRRMKAALLQ